MHFCWDPPTETRVHWEKKGGKCMGEGHKKLNISDCMGLAIGQIIGSGTVSYTHLDVYKRQVHNRIRSQKEECAEKSGLVPRRKSLVAVPDQGLYSGV